MPVLLHKKVSNQDAAAGHNAIVAGPARRYSPRVCLHVQDRTVQLLQEFSLPFRTADKEPQNYDLFGGSLDNEHAWNLHTHGISGTSQAPQAYQTPQCLWKGIAMATQLVATVNRAGCADAICSAAVQPIPPTAHTHLHLLPAGHKLQVIYQTQTSYCAVSQHRQLGLAVGSLTHGLLLLTFDRSTQPRQAVNLLEGLRT